MLRRSTPCGTALIAASTDAFSGNCGSGTVLAAGGGVFSLSLLSTSVVTGAGVEGSLGGGIVSASDDGASAGGVAGAHAPRAATTTNPTVPRTNGNERRGTRMREVYSRRRRVHQRYLVQGIGGTGGGEGEGGEGDGGGGGGGDGEGGDGGDGDGAGGGVG